MEGLADCVLRDVLTRLGGYDGACTEFVRISGSLLPLRAFRRISPELAHGSCTRAGTPVVVQLLGSDASCMAENAARLAELAPAGIDLNFGCPAPKVNRHGGGAMLLDDPAQMSRIAEAVRRAVPAPIPVSAKMRLGVSSPDRAIVCAQALAAGGVSSLVVHARTRADGYRPPARWEWVARIRQAVALPVTANGEVWSPADCAQCRAVTGCDDVMIGRGAVADPFLVRHIRSMAAEGATLDRHAEWRELQPLIGEFWHQTKRRVVPGCVPGRLKLWLNALRPTFAEAEVLYWAVRGLRGIEETERMLAQHGIAVPGEERMSALAGV